MKTLEDIVDFSKSDGTPPPPLLPPSFLPSGVSHSFAGLRVAASLEDFPTLLLSRSIEEFNLIASEAASDTMVASA